MATRVSMFSGPRLRIVVGSLRLYSLRHEGKGGVYSLASHRKKNNPLRQLSRIKNLHYLQKSALFTEDYKRHLEAKKILNVKSTKETRRRIMRTLAGGGIQKREARVMAFPRCHTG